MSWRDEGLGKRPTAVCLLVVTVAAVLAAVAAGAARADARPPVLRAGNPSGIVFARGSRPSHGGGSPNLVYHGGGVMNGGTSATAIFWGSTWTPSSDKITGLDSFYAGVGGTKYLGTTTEYTDSGAHVVNDGVAYTGHYVDSASAPQKAPSTSAVLSEVSATLVAHNQTPVANGYYPVYSDQSRGHAGYCAWHSWGTIDGTLVQFAFFFNLDGDSGCDVSGYPSGQSQGLAALGNVSGHELSEMLTDPHGDAWYDQQGAENADKCAWTFGTGPVKLGSTSWKIQGNWSNAVYNAGGSGSYLGSGSGCIDGN